MKEQGFWASLKHAFGLDNSSLDHQTAEVIREIERYSSKTGQPLTRAAAGDDTLAMNIAASLPLEIRRELCQKGCLSSEFLK